MQSQLGYKVGKLDVKARKARNLLRASKGEPREACSNTHVLFDRLCIHGCVPKSVEYVAQALDEHLCNRHGALYVVSFPGLPLQKDAHFFLRNLVDRKENPRLARVEAVVQFGLYLPHEVVLHVHHVVVQLADPRPVTQLVVVYCKRQRCVVYQSTWCLHGLLSVFRRSLRRGLPSCLPAQPLRVVVVLGKNGQRLVRERRVAHHAPHVVATARLLTRHSACRALDGIRLDVVNRLDVVLVANMVEYYCRRRTT